MKDIKPSSLLKTRQVRTPGIATTSAAAAALAARGGNNANVPSAAASSSVAAFSSALPSSLSSLPGVVNAGVGGLTVTAAPHMNVLDHPQQLVRVASAPYSDDRSAGEYVCVGAKSLDLGGSQYLFMYLSIYLFYFIYLFISPGSSLVCWPRRARTLRFADASTDCSIGRRCFHG